MCRTTTASTLAGQRGCSWPAQRISQFHKLNHALVRHQPHPVVAFSFKGDVYQMGALGRVDGQIDVLGFIVMPRYL